MNKFTNFLIALISGTSCTEQEVIQGVKALKKANVNLECKTTQADSSYKAGRNKEYCWGKLSLCSTGYILTPTLQIAVDCDSKDAGEMSAFAIGRMDDKEVFETIKRGRYNVSLVDAFLALAGVVIADSEIYSQDAIAAIIERINAPKVDVIVLEQQDVAVEIVDAEALKAARKAAKQAEKAAAIAARKGR